MVEFSIIVPILLSILLGIVQLGLVYNNWVSITDAVRAGARKALSAEPDAHRMQRLRRSTSSRTRRLISTSQPRRHRDVDMGARRRRDGESQLSLVREHHGSRRRLGNDDGYDHRTGRIDGFRRKKVFSSRWSALSPIESAGGDKHLRGT